jgi:ABC-type uncharacterized transport system auxiliary subunit
MRAWLVTSTLIVLGLGGCFGRGDMTPVQYYSVDTLPATTPRAARTWPVPLAVRAFTAATRYRDRILYRVSEVEMGFYEYHRWVEPPEEMVTRVIMAMLRASGLFPQVVTADDVQLPAWLLSGELTRFDEVRQSGGTQAECWLRLEVRQAQNEQLIWSDVLTAVVPFSAATPEALAWAMGQAVQQVGTHLIAALEKVNVQIP